MVRPDGLRAPSPKVSGSHRLIRRRIRNDAFLETTDWTEPEPKNHTPRPVRIPQRAFSGGDRSFLHAEKSWPIFPGWSRKKPTLYGSRQRRLRCLRPLRELDDRAGVGPALMSSVLSCSCIRSRLPTFRVGSGALVSRCVSHLEHPALAGACGHHAAWLPPGACTFHAEFAWGLTKTLSQITNLDNVGFPKGDVALLNSCRLRIRLGSRLLDRRGVDPHGYPSLLVLEPLGRVERW